MNPDETSKSLGGAITALAAMQLALLQALRRSGIADDAALASVFAEARRRLAPVGAASPESIDFLVRLEHSFFGARRSDN